MSTTTTAVVKKPKVAKTASHPPYFEMIKGALLALNERSGSSHYAIAKYMEEKNKAILPPNFRKNLALQLKNSASKGKLIKIKSSFKLSEKGKKDTVSKRPVKDKGEKKKKAKKAKAVKSVEAAKPNVAKKKAGSVNKVTKLAAKKVASAIAVKPEKKRSDPMAKAKQPKSIKSRAPKRTKRAVTAKA